MNKTLDQMANHLEFLGYKVEKIEPKKEGEKGIVVATHPNKNNMVFNEALPSFVFFRVSLTTERKPSDEASSFLNDVNRKSDISRIFYDIENELMIIRFEAMYIGEYTKDIFGQFCDLFEKDQKRLALLDNFSKIFLKE